MAEHLTVDETTRSGAVHVESRQRPSREDSLGEVRTLRFLRLLQGAGCARPRIR